MLKKMFLAAAVVVAGSASWAQTAQAHGPFGGYRSYGPVYRSARPMIVAPAPVYRSHRVYSAYPSYRYGHSYGATTYGAPIYQSYRPSVSVGVSSYGYPAYGPAFGTPRGFSFYFGP
jgi:hypothetical protein